METFNRNVSDLGAGERSLMEQLIGHRLSDEQKLVIRVLGANPNAELIKAATDELPDWCNLYEGLADDQIAEIEISIVRCDVSRSFE